LFCRLKRGHYIINPQLALRVEGEWRPIYELLSLELIGYRRVESDHDFLFDFNHHKEQQLQAFRARVRRLQAGHPLDDR
ncbi:MAG TPA: hypothetical protein VES89_00600, partial [Candidatus Competibacteraceae bacterium]|nr:hypothetical protein [Candidatus Competibacteraceae bacterium]